MKYFKDLIFTSHVAGPGPLATDKSHISRQQPTPLSFNDSLMASEYLISIFSWVGLGQARTRKKNKYFRIGKYI